MKVGVWDTYYTRKDGKVMHFDIIVPFEIIDSEKIYSIGQKYLEGKKELGQLLSSKQCRFCHNEVASTEIVKAIESHGYYILEMENCE